MGWEGVILQAESPWRSLQLTQDVRPQVVMGLVGPVCSCLVPWRERTEAYSVTSILVMADAIIYARCPLIPLRGTKAERAEKVSGWVPL